MTEAARVVETGTVILNVGLDPSGNPAVQIDNRIKHADSGDKIKWMRKSGVPKFQFVRIEPKDKEFGVPDVMDHKIECDFETNKPSHSKHPYTIFVTFNDRTYHSDEKDVLGGPDEGRAVIRN